MRTSAALRRVRRAEANDRSAPRIESDAELRHDFARARQTALAEIEKRFEPEPEPSVFTSALFGSPASHVHVGQGHDAHGVHDDSPKGQSYVSSLFGT